MIRALVREGVVREGDQVDVVGARCRVRSEVKRIERWRDHVQKGRSGEIITLILSDVLFTEVELGDEIYVTSSAPQRASMQERLEHRVSHRDWTEEEYHAYECGIEMGYSLRQLLAAHDPEIQQQSLDLLLSLEGNLSEAEMIDFRETLGGLVLRNPDRGYFTSTLTHFMDKVDLELKRSIERSLMRLVSSHIPYEKIPRDFLYSTSRSFMRAERCNVRLISLNVDQRSIINCSVIKSS